VTLLLALVACEAWPRYAHVPVDTGEAVLPGTVLPPEVDWLDGDTVAERSLDPAAAGELAEDVGLIWYDTLLGSGVDPSGELEPQVDSGCGLAWDFPPADRGGYLGETHWYGLLPLSSGTLCATASFNHVAVEVDLLVYDLSTCDVPRGPWDDPDTAKIVGLGAEGGRAAWRLPVIEGVPLGLALSAASPDNDETEWPYGLAVSLVARASDGHVGECPSTPIAAAR